MKTYRNIDFNTKTNHFFKRQKIQFLFLNKGQFVLEGLFFMICVLFFLISVQGFQFFAREQIQKQRLTKDNFHGKVRFFKKRLFDREEK